jgi:hypothetical protein
LPLTVDQVLAQSTLLNEIRKDNSRQFQMGQLNLQRDTSAASPSPYGQSHDTNVAHLVQQPFLRHALLDHLASSAAMVESLHVVENNHLRRGLDKGHDLVGREQDAWAGAEVRAARGGDNDVRLES